MTVVTYRLFVQTHKNSDEGKSVAFTSNLYTLNLASFIIFVIDFILGRLLK